MPVLSTGPGYLEAVAASTLSSWMSERSPQKATPDWQWRERFKITGPVWTAIESTLDARSRPVTTRLQRLTEPVPEVLYRAARDEHANNWSWTPSYEIAQGIANLRGNGTAIWKCTPGPVYARIDFTRYEEPGVMEWTVYITEPRNVTAVNRWAEPDTEMTDDHWKKRGVGIIGASSMLRSWLRGHESGTSPLDRETEEFWLKQFDELGLFHAHYELGERVGDAFRVNLEIEPVDTLEVTEPLYRGSTEDLAHRWSWTTSLDAAQRFARERGNGATVWTCDPGRIIGRIDNTCHPDTPFPPEWTEWIVMPTNVQPLEATP